MSELRLRMDRRTFVEGVGVAVLAVQCLPLSALVSGCSTSDGNEAAENLVIHSGRGFVPHTHDLLIPYALLKAPPLEGVELESTRSLFHTHILALTHEQLSSVSQGGTVTAIGGSHHFVIAFNPHLRAEEQS